MSQENVERLRQALDANRLHLRPISETSLLDMRMRARSRGIEMPFGKFAWVTTFRDGLIAHLKGYMSQSEALEAVGLSE
jgi:hypothetical protein